MVADAAPQLDASASVDAASVCPPVELQQTLDERRNEEGVVGASAAVLIAGNCSWAGASGQSNIAEDKDVVPSDRFRIASITKTFTAAVVLQLMEEDALSLDDSLEQWVPGIPGGANIRIRNLLNHTSGIFDYLADPTFDMSLLWEPAEIVTVATAHENLFEPGTDWSYSNTNYILLGMIIEKATGHTWASEVRGRLLDPLGLSDTFMEAEEEVPGGTVRGYEGLDEDVTGDFHGSAGWAAGCMVSTASDLTRWGQALFGGDVLEQATLDLMVEPTSLPDGSYRNYGLGVVILPVTGFSQVCWGHGGGLPGFISAFCYVPGQQGSYAVLLNSVADAYDIMLRLWYVVYDESMSASSVAPLDYSVTVSPAPSGSSAARW